MTKKIIVLQAISVYNGKRSCRCGGMADTLDSGSSEGNFMQVQVLSPAPKKGNGSRPGTISFLVRRSEVRGRGSGICACSTLSVARAT